MKRCHFVILFVSLLSVPYTTRSQPQVPRDGKAIAILAQSYQAMGGPGLAAIRDTETKAQVATTTAQGTSSSPVVIQTLGTRSFRTESTTAEGTVIFAVNGKGAARKPGADDAQRVSRSAMGNAGITHIPVLSVLSDWTDPGMSLEYVGLEQVDGASVHHLRLTPALAKGTPRELESPCEVFVDAQSQMVTKLVYLARRPENLRQTIPVEVTYSNYRALAGIAVPLRVRYSLGGNLLREYNVTDFSVNRGVAASQFELR